MTIKLPRIQAKDVPDLVRQLPAFVEAIEGGLRCPALDKGGQSLTGIELTTVAKAIDHKLGRAPSGWLVLRYRGGSPAAVAETTSTDKTITLIASAAVTVDLWVW